MGVSSALFDLEAPCYRLLLRHFTEGLLEALEEMKPTSVVGIELLDVELGSSAPRVLGIKVRSAPFPPSLRLAQTNSQAW